MWSIHQRQVATLKDWLGALLLYISTGSAESPVYSIDNFPHHLHNRIPDLKLCQKLYLFLFRNICSFVFFSFCNSGKAEINYIFIN